MAIDVGGYRSRGLEKAVLERERERERESFRGIQQQEAIQVGGYRSRGLERPVLERELSGDTAAGGYRGKRLQK